MTKSMSENDRRAIDLLLDRSADANNGNGNAYVTHAQTATEPSIQAVQSVLTVLDLMPVDEPTSDLLTRTLARIDSRPDMAAAEPMHPATAAMMTNRPHA